MELVCADKTVCPTLLLAVPLGLTSEFKVLALGKSWVQVNPVGVLPSANCSDDRDLTF
jgi:hypothetical protein